MTNTTHLLFSYGTLQLENVQIQNYGRILRGHKDRLPGYKLEQVKITDEEVLAKSQQEYHPIAIKTNYENDFIEGMVYEITDKELLETDEYEVDDYQRILETFASGVKAWIYIAK